MNATLQGNSSSNLIRFNRLNNLLEQYGYYNLKHKLLTAWQTTIQYPALDRALNQKLLMEISMLPLKKPLSKIIWLGIGGSILPAKALYHYLNFSYNLIDCQFIEDYTSPLWSSLASIDFKDALIIVVSKSGRTIETLTALQQILQLSSTPEIIAVTQENTPLWQIAKKYNFNIVEWPASVGGRYSITSITGLLLLYILQIPADDYLVGISSLTDCQDPLSCLATVNILEHLLHIYNNKAIHIGATYCLPLQQLLWWWRQLWAESLGKHVSFLKRYVPYPYISFFPADQHSQLQMYGDGRQNIYFSFWSLPTNTFYNDQNQLYRSLIQQQQTSLYNYLQHHKIPFMLNKTEHNNLFSLGQLVAHMILEVTMLAYILEIDPYNQPVVEEFKKQFCTN